MTMYTIVDASFAVQDDMKSHTGGVITLRRGGIACKSTKQKLVTKSSTEAELVGASEYLPSTIWIQHYLEAQGLPLRHSYFKQDNQSAMRLERNGPASTIHGPDISIFVISSSLTALTRITLPLVIVRRNICLPISFPSPYKGTCFVSFVTSFWVLPLCPHCASPRISPVRSVLSGT